MGTASALGLAGHLYELSLLATMPERKAAGSELSISISTLFI
jgi:hypothetical protein